MLFTLWADVCLLITVHARGQKCNKNNYRSQLNVIWFGVYFFQFIKTIKCAGMFERVSNSNCRRLNVDKKYIEILITHEASVTSGSMMQRKYYLP